MKKLSGSENAAFFFFGYEGGEIKRENGKRNVPEEKERGLNPRRGLGGEEEKNGK